MTVVVVVPDQATDLARATHIARGIDVTQRSVATSGQAADPDSTTHIARGIDVAERAVIVVPQQATDALVPGHVAGGVSVAERAGIAKSYQLPYVVVAGYGPSQQSYIAQHVAGTGKSEQADIILCGTVDDEVADRMPQSVELSGEASRAGAYRREARAGVPATGRRGIDVVGQAVEISKHPRAAHALHAVNVGQPIGISCRSVAAQCTNERAAGNAEIIGSKAWKCCGYLIPGAAVQRKGVGTDNHVARADRAIDIQVAGR